MKSTRLSPITSLPLLTFLVSAWLAAGLFYRELPNLVPTHWSNPFEKANGFTPKPWGAFVFPLAMTLIWLARPLTRRLAPPRQRIERFPGAFDFRMMLTVGLVFVIWTLVVAQSVSWLRAVAVPASVALVVAGGFLATMPFDSASDVGLAGRSTGEADWLRTRKFASCVLLASGVAILASIVLAS